MDGWTPPVRFAVPSEIISGKWTLLVIRDLADESRRFCELERSLEGISPRTLSLRLRALEEHGIVARHTYPEVPPRVEYALTEKGEALVPLIEDMRKYGRRWLGDAKPDGRGTRRRRRPRLGQRGRYGRCNPACIAGGPRARAKHPAMRDLVVREALRAMARESAKRLRELVANGAEIPYDVDGTDSASPLCQYKPLTDRFIGDHADALRALDSFGAACAAIESADLAGPYLEQMGVNVPAEPRRRAELAGIAFLCRLWIESTDFSLEPERLDAAISELDAPAEISEGEIEVIVPLRGLQMPVERLPLEPATIVRADTVEVPNEARAFEGSGAAGWEPTYPRGLPPRRRGRRRGRRHR